MVWSRASPVALLVAPDGNQVNADLPWSKLCSAIVDGPQGRNDNALPRHQPYRDQHQETGMMRIMLQAKLHRVRVTEADLHYEGSCGIDRALLDASGIVPNQYIELYNINNGERFSTYVIEAPRGSGTISLNGAAARKAMVGDLLIICAYSHCGEAEMAAHRPVVVLVDEHNQPIRS
jgi:aspartate 1-decarboxylase